MTETTIGERIKIIIKEQKLKQTDFARTLGISSNYVYLLTSGRKDSVSDTLAKLIETIYGYPAEWVQTGNYTAPDNNLLTELQKDTIMRVKRMGYQELIAIAAFIQALEKVSTQRAEDQNTSNQ